jgi:excisionase family DNA binding protein
MAECTTHLIEPLYSLKEAAERLNIKYWLLLRAANSGEIPTHRIGNSRRRVFLSEVVAAIRNTA